MATKSSKQWLDWIWACGFILMAAFLLGCASVSPPNDALSTADVALSRAIDGYTEGYTDSTGSESYAIGPERIIITRGYGEAGHLRG